jgi:hypothetical protein
MAKVIKPKKEFWESDKKPTFLKISPKINETNEGSYNVSLCKDKNQKKKKARKV